MASTVAQPNEDGQETTGLSDQLKRAFDKGWNQKNGPLIPSSCLSALVA
jgi:hypothetical protein